MVNFDIGAAIGGDLHADAGMRALINRMAEIRAGVGRKEMLAGRDPAGETVRYSQGGLNMTPFGFFHPSELMPVVVGNAKRGRIIRDPAKANYAHTIGSDGRAVEIRQFGESFGGEREAASGKPVSETTYCAYAGDAGLMLTFERDNEGELGDFLAVYRRGRPGQIDHYAFGMWIGGDRFPSMLTVERLVREREGAREIEWFEVSLDGKSGELELSVLDRFELTYRGGKCVDWSGGARKILFCSEGLKRQKPFGGANPC